MEASVSSPGSPITASIGCSEGGSTSKKPEIRTRALGAKARAFSASSGSRSTPTSRPARSCGPSVPNRSAIVAAPDGPTCREPRQQGGRVEGASCLDLLGRLDGGRSHPVILPVGSALGLVPTVHRPRARARPRQPQPAGRPARGSPPRPRAEARASPGRRRRARGPC